MTFLVSHFNFANAKLLDHKRIEKVPKKNNEFKTVCEALSWAEDVRPKHAFKNSAHWQTENRDAFRYFLDAPEKQDEDNENDEIQQQEVQVEDEDSFDYHPTL